jgi:hypothetical protein
LSHLRGARCTRPACSLLLRICSALRAVGSEIPNRTLLSLIYSVEDKFNRSTEQNDNVPEDENRSSMALILGTASVALADNDIDESVSGALAARESTGIRCLGCGILRTTVVVVSRTSVQSPNAIRQVADSNISGASSRADAACCRSFATTFGKGDKRPALRRPLVQSLRAFIVASSRLRLGSV